MKTFTESAFESIEKAHAAGQVFAEFCTKWGDKLPRELFHHSFDGQAYYIYSHLNILCRTSADRDKALAFIGDALGRDGWTSEEDRHNRGFTWSKVVDGIQIKIIGAEVLPPVTASPVPPSKFPLQLADAIPA